MDNLKLSPEEEKFCLIFTCGPSPYNGNASRTYELVFHKRTGIEDPNENNRIIADIDNTLAARELMQREDIKTRIDQLKTENMVNASTLTPRLTAALLRIMDECSTLTVVDRWDRKVSPAALRSVAVNAAGKLMDMYGIKEDIAHKVVLEGNGKEGITFNLIMPESSKENDMTEIDS